MIVGFLMERAMERPQAAREPAKRPWMARALGWTVSCLLLLAGATQASAQSAGYPMFQGAPERQGQNSNPKNVNSGVSFLQWFTPYGYQPTTSITVDNTDTLPPNGQYQPDLFGVATPKNAGFGGFFQWQPSPTSTTELATNPAAYIAYGSYIPDVASSLGTNNYTYKGTAYPYTLNFEPRWPDYDWVEATPAASYGSPTMPGTANQLATFDWEFFPNPNPWAPLPWAPVAQSYALYVNIPYGPQFDGTNLVYPQEFFVYQITYGSGQTFIDVVDTYATGFGWVRLGNGGLPTNQVFNYDGTDPIHITLLNTIPLTSNGSLSTPTGAGYTLAVYADAAMAVPQTGYYNASPVSDYLRNNVGNPIVDPHGDPDVTSAGAAYFARLLSAENVVTPTNAGSVNSYTTEGQVQAIQINPHDWTVAGIPTVLWQYQTNVNSPLYSDSVVNGTSESAGWNADTANPNYQGANYLSSPIDPTPPNPAAATVTYAPTLANGNYTVYAYLPGNGGGETYPTQLQYFVDLGSTPVFEGTVNEAAGGGWVQIGIGNNLLNNTTSNGSFTQTATSGGLTVVLTNGSTFAGDAGTTAYANAVKFVGGVNLAINSTPIITQVPITQMGGAGTVLTQVAIVADESGRIHCLDYTGNGDGTTTEYWSYPSTPDPNNPTWQDPNLTGGIDGTPNASNTPIATMPSQFNLSSGLVADVNGDYRLFIASANGRVYCIETSGRGDFNNKTGTIGSTPRLWSYPSDYPSTIVQSKLGPFIGSLVFGGVADNLAAPTIFAPASQGRIYSLDAAGNQLSRTTTVNWTYPLVTQPALPPIEMTPALSQLAEPTSNPPKLFFGTLQEQETNGPGTFYALNARTGAVIWYFNGLTNGAIDGANNQLSTIESTVQLPTDFVTGPVPVPAALLAETGIITHAPENSVFVLNNNLHLYGLDADTGGFITSQDGNKIPYDTNELQVLANGNLGFQWMSVYRRTTGTQSPAPVILIPTAEGHIYGMFANPNDYNYYSIVPGGPYYFLAWGYQTVGLPNSLAFSDKRMVANDTAGYQYVFDANASGNGLETTGSTPGQQVVPPNEPGPPDAFRWLHIKFLSAAEYALLREVNPDGTAGDTYAGATTAAFSGLPQKGYPGSGPYAFEWGETAYIMVYGFPYETSDVGGNAIAPPIVNIRISVAGKVVRQLQVDARQFESPTSSPTLFNPRDVTWPSDWNSTLKDGFGVLAYTFQGGGANALPPGTGAITADITTAAINNNGASVEIASDPNPTSPDPNDRTPGTLDFYMANPIGVEVQANPFGNSTVQSYNTAIGMTNDPYLVDAQVNGSPPINSGTGISDTYYAPGASSTSTLTTEYTDQLMQSLGFVSDGQTATATFNVYDRSLMCLLRPGGTGLDGVRFDRMNFQWQGGANTMYNPLDPDLYPGFEDQPVNSPNTSLDYPDITMDNLSFAVNPNGNAQNPLLTTVALNAPLTSGAATGGEGANQPLTESMSANDLYTRAMVPTPIQVSLNVLKYQPGVNVNPTSLPPSAVNIDGNLFSNAKADGSGNSFTGTGTTVTEWYEPQGYFMTFHIFNDVTGSGQLSSQDSYRTLHLAVGLNPDWAIYSDTPNLDLKSLSQGTGYSTASPANQSPNYNANAALNAYNPWDGGWLGAYGPFSLRNNGNINILDLHVEKGYDVGLTGPAPWPIYSTSNDPSVWLDGSFDLWSNLDSHFGMVNPNWPSADSTFYSSAIFQNSIMFQKARVTDRAPTTLSVNPVARLNPNTGATGTGSPLNPNYTTTTPLLGVSVPPGFPSGTYQSTISFMEDLPIPGGATYENPYQQIWEPYPGANANEPISDPGLPLSFKVAETRLTNTNSQYTAPMADNLGPSGAVGAGQVVYPWHNETPAAFRDSFGTLVTAFSSDRATATQLWPVVAAGSSGHPANGGPFINSIFVSSMANSSTYSGNPSSGSIAPGGTDPVQGLTPLSPLADLNFFVPASTSQWMASQTPNGFPASSQFAVDGTVVPGTEGYDSPAFPLTGTKDPFWWADGSTSVWQSGNLSYMAFVGNAQINTASGRVPESKVFLAPFTTTQTTGAVSFNSPTPVNDDVQTAKGKPSVVSVPIGSSAEALVFYPVTAGSQTAIHVDRYTGSAFAPHMGLNFGTGFQSVNSPSAYLRPYAGASTSYPANMKGLIDLVFTGKLRGRSNNEIYFGRLMMGAPADDPNQYHLIDGSGNDAEVPGSGTPFAYFPHEVNERLSADGQPGQYRSRGVEWNLDDFIGLVQAGGGLLSYDQNGNPTPIAIPSTMVVDRESGLMSCDSTFGGKVFFDAQLGTIRFTQSLPGKATELRLTYSPAFLRITTGGTASYSQPTEVYDDHYLSDPTEWYAATATTQTFRSMFFFGRAADETNQTAQPYMVTMRFGIRLPTRIATVAGGGLAGAITITYGAGNTAYTGAYQVDPANGRIYFPAQAEDLQNVTVTYTGVNESTGATVPVTTTGNVSYVLEQDEQKVPMDTAINEASLYAFPDPYSYSSMTRPPLIWMFFTSTRNGGPDVYFQTIAPRLSPVVK